MPRKRRKDCSSEQTRLTVGRREEKAPSASWGNCQEEMGPEEVACLLVKVITRETMRITEKQVIGQIIKKV